MNNWIAVFLVLTGMALGFAAGLSYGVGMAVDKAILAADILFDIELKGKIKQMALQFPEILKRIDKDTKNKLGLNDSEYYEEMNKKLNETITYMNNIKYPDNNQLKGGENKNVSS